MRHTHPLHTLLLLIATTLLATACHNAKPHAEATADGQEDLVLSPDISNQNVKAFAEDTLGHVWMATFRGVNRYDAHEYRQYFCTDDSVGLVDNNTNTLFCDSRGRLWVGTVNGPCRYTDQDRFERYTLPSENHNVQQFLETSDGRILLYNLSGIYELDEEHHRFEPRLRGLLTAYGYTGLCIADGSSLWVCAPSCLRRYDLGSWQLRDSIALERPAWYFNYMQDGTLWMSNSGLLQRFSLRKRAFEELPQGLTAFLNRKDDAVQLVHPYGPHGLLLATTRGRTYFYDTAADRLMDRDDAQFPFEMTDAPVNAFFTDSRGNLWIGTADKGAQVVSNRSDDFTDISVLNRNIGNSTVKSVVTDGGRHLFIATWQRGLFVYDTTTRQVSPLRLNTASADKDNQCLHLYVDREGDLWIGTIDAVLRCRYDGQGLQVLRRWDVFMPLCFAEDQDGQMWVTTSSVYVYIINRDAEKAETLQLFPNAFLFIPAILPMDNGQLLVAAFNRDLQVIDPRTREFSALVVRKGDMEQCIRRSVFIPVAMAKDQKGDVWIATNTNGVMVYSPRTRTMTPVKGLSCNDVTAIEPAADGTMWISTMNGLNCYDPRTQQATAYYKSQGTGGNQFCDRSSARLADGTLVFGGTHGLTVFRPEAGGQHAHAPLVLEYVKIHNRVVRPGSGVIEQSLDQRPRVSLRHDESSFSITYASLDYNDLQRTHYYYKMDGFDADWHDAGGDHTAYYANLPAGRYTFRVRTSNDGRQTEATASIDIRVGAHPLLSWWAWLVYLAAAAAAVFYISRVRRRIVLQKEATRRAETEREQEARLNEMNMSFFANISHEFRTPLTMIAGPTDVLVRDASLTQEAHRMVEIIGRSVRRMLRLVNQLMDFNKLENDALRLHVERLDVAHAVRQICDVFAFNMSEKGIAFLLTGADDPVTGWADDDKLDKIIGNLLSNALKFTPREGSVTVTLDLVSREQAAAAFPLDKNDTDERYVQISVSDSGPGLPESQLEEIFRRYYQVDNQTKGTINWGTGIGLYYARRLATLHHGYIKAGNRTAGHGAVFSLLLPMSTTSYTDEERQPLPDGQSAAFPIASKPSKGEEEASRKDDRPTIMVIDDDTEIADYLTALLSADYNVLSRFDADSALRTLADTQPSLILSDVMMPGKDGFQLCREIKNDIQLCHIPVILVTAKCTTDNQIEGLDTGADAYVTKPFVPSLLLAQIRSLLSNRERARQVLGRATKADKHVEEVLSAQDRAFMEELYRLMEDELANSELDIVRITEMLRISRTKFYYKIKGLTGETPAAFFRTYKLNRATQLLVTGRYNISEVANLTGFSTQAHFATLFKKQFGMTPTEYAETNNG